MRLWVWIYVVPLACGGWSMNVTSVVLGSVFTLHWAVE